MVIPVRDRAAGLDRCLAALGDSYPVIVVDDGSRDPAAVARVCARRGARLRRRRSSGGAGQARNDGLALVTTSLVAFIDSDCAADRRMDHSARRALRRPAGRERSRRGCAR